MNQRGILSKLTSQALLCAVMAGAWIPAYAQARERQLFDQGRISEGIPKIIPRPTGPIVELQ